MGNVKLGNTGDEPAAPAQYPHIEGKRKKKKNKERKAAWVSFLIPTPGKITQGFLLSTHYLPLHVVPTFF